jgi:hypothetical protein
MLHESFLRHRHWFYLKLSAGLCAAAIVLYAWHDPVDGPSGGTWLGYTLGTVGAALIAALAWLGVRKRQYRSTAGSVKGWVSAHVYLGLSLLVLVTLHTGFQLGWNLHTLAYALMVLVIASGVYGMVVYARYPAFISENRQQATRDAWLAEILDLNEQSIKLADSLGPAVHNVVVKSAEHVRIGGSRWDLLFGTITQDNALAQLNVRLGQLTGDSEAPRMGQTMIFMASQIIKGRGQSEGDQLRSLLDLLARRNELAVRLNRDLQAHARMQVWLFVHVPMSAALLAALLAHIVSVFLYW